MQLHRHQLHQLRRRGQDEDPFPTDRIDHSGAQLLVTATEEIALSSDDTNDKFAIRILGQEVEDLLLAEILS